MSTKITDKRQLEFIKAIDTLKQFTNAEIAGFLGISRTTMHNYLAKDKKKK